MKYFSMFSGIGGFELGINQAFQCASTIQPERQMDVLRPTGHKPDSDGQLGDGWRTRPICVGYSEIDKYAIATYEKNFGKEIKNYGDATTINTAELPDFDLLVGGFPCQAFSVAGKRAGFNDTRGTLIFDVVRILRDKRPRYFVLENVKGLLSHDSGKTFAHILEILTDSGYDVSWSVHNSKNYGVPQNRERIYLIGNLRGERRPQVFPIAENGGWASEGGQRIQREIRDTDTQRPSNNAESQLLQDGEDGHLSKVRPAQWRRTELGKEYRKESQQRGQDKTPFGVGYREIVPKDSDTIGTITAQAIAKDSLLFEDVRIRRLTPKECERLQGFPDNWTIGSDTQRYKQCGNAVTVNVINHVISEMMECF